MLSRRLMVLTFVVLGIHPLYGRDKTDIVYFVNGDVIHCEIKKLQRGKLTVKSIGFGTIDIEWDKIAHIESEHPYQFELQSGIRYLGAGLRFDIGENFLAEGTFEFFDVLANREDFRLNRLSFAAGFRF